MKKLSLKTCISLFILTWLLMIIVSCSPQRKCERAMKVLKENCSLDVKVTIKDTVLIAYRDTVLKIQKDSFIAFIQSPCDSLGKLKSFDIIRKGKRGSVHLYSDNNIIHADVECDAIKLKLDSATKIINHYRNTIIENAYTQPKELTRWQKVQVSGKNFMCFIGLIAIVILALKFWKG